MNRSAVGPSVWGYTIVALIFLWVGLAGVGGTLADRIVGWPMLAAGIYCLFSAWKDWFGAERARRQGVEVEARIVSRGQPPQGMTLPQAIGIVFRRLTLEYQVNGRTVVSRKLVPEQLVRELEGRSTLTVRVLPARPLLWVPVG